MGLFQTFGDDGTLQLDCDYATYFLRYKGQTQTESRKFANTNTSSLTIGLGPEWVRPLIALQCAGGKVGLYSVRRPGDGSAYYQYVSDAAVGSVVNFWIFDNPAVLGVSSGGLTLFNEIGAVTYNSDYPALQAIDVLSIGGTAGGFYDRIWSRRPSTTSFPGRNLAFAQACYGGHRIKAELVANGAGPIADPDPEGRYRWTHRIDGKAYGASSNGSSVTFGSISVDDVTATVGSNLTMYEAEAIYNAAPDFFVRGIGLVVDVTNL